LPVYLTLKSKNIGFYQYVSAQLNNSIALITGQTSGITLFNNTYTLPAEPDLSFIAVSQAVITGYTNSDLIVSIKSYDPNQPYKIGSKIVDGKLIDITEVSAYHVAYTIDLINYITYFNINTYRSDFLTSSITTNNRFIFDPIVIDDKYSLTIILSGNTTANTEFYVFKNNIPLMPITLESGKKNKSTKIELVTGDFLELIMSGGTSSSSLSYSLVPEENNNEANYNTIYFFGNKTLTANNSLSDGFIYKSDVQHYDEKPIVFNNIKVVRNGLSVFDSIFKLESVGNINDFEEFFVID
jgi:hypothetical protein